MSAIPDELVDKMADLVRDLHASHLRCDLRVREQDFCKRTAAIAAELPPPVDPDLVEAQNLLAKFYEDNDLGTADHIAAIRAGDRADRKDVRGFLLAIKHGRALAEGPAK